MVTFLARGKPSTANAALLIMILAAACWGLGTVLSKFTLEHIPPITLMVIELSASCSLLWAMLIASGGHKGLRWKTIRRGWAGILEPGSAFALCAVGLTMTSATNASLIGVTEPVIVVILAACFLRERTSRRLLTFVGLALAGTLFISGSEGGAGGTDTLMGNALVLGSAACAALYTIVTRRAAQSVPPLTLAALQQSFGLAFVILLLPLEWVGNGGTAWASVRAGFSLESLLWAALTGIIGSGLAFLLYLSALRYVTATQAALVMTAIPLFGVAGAVVLLGEVLTAVHIVGGGLIAAVLMRLRVEGHSPPPLAGERGLGGEGAEIRRNIYR
ncbi:MAG TPA: DMT family transporter [Aggregatilineales bacterium]|nr:DMT family transporter [Anaerolineales bacterium]HRE48106.1 DMT family transporter [Aggregatilineales bacterium]